MTDPAPKSSGYRNLLLWVVPALMIVGGLAYYIVGGRFIETDNAYLKADLVAIYPEVEARVEAVLVHENMDVEAGRPLVRLDAAGLQIEARQAEARLGTVRADLEAAVRQYRRQLEERALALEQSEYATRELTRQRGLVASHLIAVERFDAATHESKLAQARVAVVDQGLAEMRTRLGPALEGRIDAHPKMREAQAALEAARLRLAHASIDAPVPGRIVHVPERGVMARKAAPLLTLVSSGKVWVEANFKETQLGLLRTGQHARIVLDTYPGVEWTGHVETISPASGSEFAVLPPQNASGNWVKVVQRIPVRIAIDSGPPGLVLRAGSSAAVSIDTETRPRLAQLARLF
jgi:membrane fusion protein (multidrug efflux system)